MPNTKLKNQQVQLNRCLELGDLDQALILCRSLVVELPTDSALRFNLGLCQEKTGDFESAVSSYQKAIMLDAGLLQAHLNLGVLLRALKRYQESVSVFESVLAMGESLLFRLHLAAVLRLSGEPERGLSVLEEAPPTDEPDLLLEQARCLEASGRFSDALGIAEVLLRSNNHVGHAALIKGVAFMQQRQVGQAVLSFRQAVAMLPDSVIAQTNLGSALASLAEFGQAEWAFRQSVSRFDDPAAKLNLGYLLLTQERYAEGWECCEARLHHKIHPEYTLFEPRWRGETLKGKRLLIVAEQGLGDSIQMARYFEELKSLGATVIVKSPPNTAEVMTCVPGVDEIIYKDSAAVSYHYAIPMMSLPYQFQEDLTSDRHEKPYISLSTKLKQTWSERLQGIELTAGVPAASRLKIGINWQGNPTFVHDALRSIPLNRWEKLFERMSGVSVNWYCLQKGEPGKPQLASFRHREQILDLDIAGYGDRSLLDTAAIISQLDLVITSCSGIAHLSAALGKPTWILLAHTSDWRWGLVRNDSPWYPTVRLFRQSEPDDWDDVFVRVARALNEELV